MRTIRHGGASGLRQAQSNNFSRYNCASDFSRDRRIVVSLAGMNSGLLATLNIGARVPSPAHLWLIYLSLMLFFFLPNPAHAQDSDSDLIPDAYELLHPCLNPSLPDANIDYDLDAMTSLEEYQYSPLLDPCLADTDMDGVNDGIEVSNGANPLDDRITPVYGPPEKVGVDLRVTSASGSGDLPSLFWTGSEFGVSWKDNRDGSSDIYFTRVSGSGVENGDDVRLTADTSSSDKPSLAWTGSEYGVSWHDFRDGNLEIYFARVSASGVKLGNDVRITANAADSLCPCLTWTGSEYGVSWYDFQVGSFDIYFTRVSAGGMKIGNDLRVTTSPLSAVTPALTWTGSEFGVSWEDYRDGSGSAEIYFARVSASGGKIGNDTRITANASDSNGRPSLTWTGSEFGLSWADERDGNFEIYFTRVSAGGVEVGNDARITANALDSFFPSLVWTGSEFGVSWDDERDGNREIYFTRVSSGGAEIGDDLRITASASWSVNPSLAWTGSEFGVSWRDNQVGDNEIFFARIGYSFIDADGDGLITGEEAAAGSNPYDWDTDDEGLSDGEEVKTYNTDPLYWDTDHDAMPDGYEAGQVGNLPPLDPLDPGDGPANFDADSNPNYHEYWNGSDPWKKEPVGAAGCFYWGDAGMGDGIVSPTDAIELKKAITGAAGNYRGVIPGNGETHELDMDGIVSPDDLIILQKMIVQAAIPMLGSRPNALQVLESPLAEVAVGMTCHVSVGVRNEGGSWTPGFGVIYEIVQAQSSGTATLCGGEGAATPGAATPMLGSRYDVSGTIASSGRSRMVLRMDSAGTVRIRAMIPQCGVPGVGRYSPELILDPAAVIHAE